MRRLKLAMKNHFALLKQMRDFKFVIQLDETTEIILVK